MVRKGALEEAAAGRVAVEVFGRGGFSFFYYFLKTAGKKKEEKIGLFSFFPLPDLAILPPNEGSISHIKENALQGRRKVWNGPVREKAPRKRKTKPLLLVPAFFSFLPK